MAIEQQERKTKEPRETFEVTPDTIKPYFAGKKFHKNYDVALDYYRHMSFHFDGYFVHIPPNGGVPVLNQQNQNNLSNADTAVYFTRLIDMRRPSESPEIQAYRRLNYLPITKQPCFKVYNALRKIVKADDWNIDYSEAKPATGVADSETLKDYCEKNYPRFGSIENWAYNYGMKNMLIDANALIYVLPKDFDLESSTDYYEPVATIVKCKHVLDFKENEYAIFIHERKSEYKVGKTTKEGKILGIITKEGYWEAAQLNDKQDFQLTQIMQYDMERLPAWLTGGVVKELYRHYTLSESFLAPMLPGLDGMAQASSDETAEWVQHVYTTMWYFTQQECKSCNGTGKVQGKGKQTIQCTKCQGQGVPTKSPYKDLVLKAGSFDTDKMPTPPMGFVEKKTEVVKVFEERINKLEWRSLSSINHEFLAETPLAQSGKAKDSDRQELLNYTYSVAYHVVENVIAAIYYFTNEFRYMIPVPDAKAREAQLPKFAIPVQYDLTTEADISAQIAAAKENGMDPELIAAWEIEYLTKKFPNNIELREKLKTIKQFDPFKGNTPAEKNEMLLAKSAAIEDIVLSNYIYQFTEQAMEEDEKFLEKKYPEKAKVYDKLVKAKMKELSAAEKVKNANQPPSEDDQVEDPKKPGFDTTGKPMAKKAPTKK